MPRGLRTDIGLGKLGCTMIYGLSVLGDKLLLTYTLKVIYTGAFQPVGVMLARAPMGVHQWDITWRQFGRYLFVCSVLFSVRGVFSNFS